MILRAACLAIALLIGWLLGSVFPAPLWPHSDCHRLGGALRTLDGPGKPTECVIPWQDH